MRINIPKVENIIYSKDNNIIIHNFLNHTDFKDFEIISSSPFIISSDQEYYFVTSNINDKIPINCKYALLSSRKPTKKDFDLWLIKIKIWIKHPFFRDLTPENVVDSWDGKFKFIKEDIESGKEWLRSPQIWALYSILSHIQDSDERWIVVMPTGTWKTETMLCTMIANKCKKILVTVPSDSLRTQLSNKFISLSLLRKFNIIDNTCYDPIVGVINQWFKNKEDLSSFINKCNVVVTTMDILTDSPQDQKYIISSNFSNLFVDEAHHSEAKTWKEFIDLFDKSKVLLFTATPFRNDGKKLNWKFIFNFSLRKAQKQKYYKKINFLPIREYDKDKADKKIAIKAVNQLRDDISHWYNHIIMARCLSKNRAIEVFEYYKDYHDLNPVLIYTWIPWLKDKIISIKEKRHNIIVCVNMLGEWFDLPELKIAAIHDERQSLPVALQFIWRFTRESFDRLGNASFITNLAYPPLQEELNILYSRDADWNLLLPNISEISTDKEINFKNFLDWFNNLEKSNIPFQNIKPAMSTVVYYNSSVDWNPSKWKEWISKINTYQHQFSDYNNDNKTLVIILWKIIKIDWWDFDTVQNMEWNMIVVHWQYSDDKNLVFIHSSFDFSTDKLVKSIFWDNFRMIKDMNVFKIFHDVKRLTLYNVWARKNWRDISFQSFFWRWVQDGIDLLLQWTLIKNNIFWVWFKEWEKVSLGCSVKGKIWSYLRWNLDELVQWCHQIWDILINPNINTNIVLENTLVPVIIDRRPQEVPIAIEWHPEMYEHTENSYVINIEWNRYDLSNSELDIIQTPINQDLRFCFKSEDFNIEFELQLWSRDIDWEIEVFYKIKQLSQKTALISYQGNTSSLEEFFQTYTPTIWFANEAQLFQNSYVKPKNGVDWIPLNNIVSLDWTWVSLNKESQYIYPYEQDSIQYFFINKIKEDFQIIYDDDWKWEIADIIWINTDDKKIDIHLYHLKYAKDWEINNDIENFYHVCWQAQKSLNWKYRNWKDFFDHLLRRKTKTKNWETCSRIIKGTEDDLELLLNAAKWTKEMKFHIYIVQPSLSKNNASNDILLLLGNTYHYLHTIGNVKLKVFTS